MSIEQSLDAELATNDPELLRHKINLETASLAWKEVERFFATGHLIRVASGVDLVDVALAMSQDDAATLKGWMDAKVVEALPDSEAAQWAESNAELWAVVVKPWVLVQFKGE
ncbi:DUF2288 domain-containing protein [Pokkaliibacter sp. CJK22405]|uniref:DUF2288 domain-containing protein n=1 Tax=Pokkaliibacter sp. CJK22405 TaxID=3384615 RepID=UPI0039849290